MMGEKHENNQPCRHVIACVVERHGRLLICRRPQHKRHGGLWEFPGGKLEPGEDWLAAAKRELDEELALSVQAAGEPLLAVHDEGSAYVIDFVPVQAEGTPRLIEHTQLKWLPAAELVAMPLAPTDRKFVEFLLQQGARK